MTHALAIPILLASLTGAIPDSSSMAPDSTGAMPVSVGSLPDSSAARPDSARVVRQFPEVEVRALLHDFRSSQTVHLIPPSALHSLPVDGLADVLELQPGVVVTGEELHVRGGRAGETVVYVDGLRINEPLRSRSMSVPLIGLRSAELISGAPEAQYGGGLAGVLNLRTADPAERPEFEWRWQTDGGLDTRYDRVAARASTPLPRGLGMVAAADVTFDDTWLPALATQTRHDLAGLSVGWRADNHMLGSLKIAPVGRSDGLSAELFAARHVYQPYSPNWSVDGWILVPANLKVTPTYSPVPLPGYLRYIAADHLAMTDDRSVASQVKYSIQSPSFVGGLGLGWLHNRTWHSIQGRKTAHDAIERPRYGSPIDVDGFYVLWGDDPLYRESGSDVYSLRLDATIPNTRGFVATGFGINCEDVQLYELDHMPLAPRSADASATVPLDSVRTFDVQAPGFYGYLQTRWNFEGFVLNAGLRAEYFAPGEAATEQTLPGSADGQWSFGPRLGVAYPISNRDVFSLAYVRIQQSPGRDFLYDTRTAITNRQPLGNPAMAPATSISYEASVKHVFDPTWAFQSSVFYRDVYGQVGSLDLEDPNGLVNLQYVDEDQCHSIGFELGFHHASGERARFDAVYTWMQAWGNESRPEGDPYGPIRSPNTPALGTQPLSWDRRHSIAFSGNWRWRERWSLGWSTAIGSPLPWTPKPRREPFTDLSQVNSERLGWTENTNLSIQWSPRLLGLAFGLEVRNLFGGQYQRVATVDGYPNPTINTTYDDYGAYRTETGQSGGGYWSTINDQWVAVNDPRLYTPPRMVRASVGARW